MTGTPSIEERSASEPDRGSTSTAALMPAIQPARVIGPPSALATSIPRGWNAGGPGGEASVIAGDVGAGGRGRAGGGGGGATLSCGWSVIPPDCRGSQVAAFTRLARC